jgi:hypothetical protein
VRLSGSLRQIGAVVVKAKKGSPSEDGRRIFQKGVNASKSKFARCDGCKVTIQKIAVHRLQATGQKYRIKRIIH